MKTWGQMKSEIQSELNISGEEFVTASDLMKWANEAKDEAEKEIVSLYDKYLETQAPLQMTLGSDVVTLPADIFANKITGLWYKRGTEAYEIFLIKRKEEIYGAGQNDFYRFYLDNQSGVGVRVRLVPEARETGEVLRCHYIRESAPIVDDDSLMDLPIADSFIEQYLRDQVRNREMGPAAQKTRSELLEKQKTLLIEALNQMVPDDSSDAIESDFSHYDDSGVYYG